MVRIYIYICLYKRVSPGASPFPNLIQYDLLVLNTHLSPAHEGAIFHGEKPSQPLAHESHFACYVTPFYCCCSAAHCKQNPWSTKTTNNQQPTLFATPLSEVETPLFSCYHSPAAAIATRIAVWVVAPFFRHPRALRCAFSVTLLELLVSFFWLCSWSL